MAIELASADLSRTEAEALVRDINQQSEDVREKIRRLHNGQGWKALGHTSWKDCVEKRFVFGRQYAYRLLEAAETDRIVSPKGDTHLPESHVRELAAVADDKKAEVYEAAKKTAPNGDLTAEHIRKTIGEMKLGPNRWGARATAGNMVDYLEALENMTAPQIEAVLRKCLSSIPSRVLFKAVDETRYMTPSENSSFNSAPWTADKAA